jgi:hypothetical protein
LALRFAQPLRFFDIERRALLCDPTQLFVDLATRRTGLIFLRPRGRDFNSLISEHDTLYSALTPFACSFLARTFSATLLVR